MVSITYQKKIGCTFDLKAPTTQCAKITMCQNVHECQKCKILTTFWGKCANLTISQSHPPGSSSEKCSRAPFLLPLVTDVHYFFAPARIPRMFMFIVHVLSFVTDIHYFCSCSNTTQTKLHVLSFVIGIHFFCSYSNTMQTKIHILSFVTGIHYFCSHSTKSRKQNFHFLSLESDDEGDSLGPLVVHLLLQGRDAVSSLLAHDCVRVPACGFKRCQNMRLFQVSVRSLHCSGEEDHLNTFNIQLWVGMIWDGLIREASVYDNDLQLG